MAAYFDSVSYAGGGRWFIRQPNTSPCSRSRTGQYRSSFADSDISSRIPLPAAAWHCSSNHRHRGRDSPSGNTRRRTPRRVPRALRHRHRVVATETRECNHVKAQPACGLAASPATTTMLGFRVLARKAGKPVRGINTREKVFSRLPAARSRRSTQVGLQEDGRIRANN